jgi:hypothetical protein
MIRLKKLTNYQKNIFLLKQIDDSLHSFQFFSSYIIFFLSQSNEIFLCKIKNRFNIEMFFKKHENCTK